MRATRTIVVFETGAFKTSAPQAHFINAGCYGEDLLRAVSVSWHHAAVFDADEGQGAPSPAA